jgi:hypothetical protein
MSGAIRCCFWTTVERVAEIYDLATNTGWVSLGVDHDTAALR